MSSRAFGFKAWTLTYAALTPRKVDAIAYVHSHPVVAHFYCALLDLDRSTWCFTISCEQIVS